MPQDVPLPSPDHRLLRGALQLLGYVTAANSSSVRRNLALLRLPPGDGLQCTTCSVHWSAASSPLAAPILRCCRPQQDERDCLGCAAAGAVSHLPGPMPALSLLLSLTRAPPSQLSQAYGWTASSISWLRAALACFPSAPSGLGGQGSLPRFLLLACGCQAPVGPAIPLLIFRV